HKGKASRSSGEDRVRALNQSRRTWPRRTTCGRLPRRPAPSWFLPPARLSPCFSSRPFPDEARPFNRLQVRQDQLRINNGDICGWVDRAINVDDIVIGEGAHNLTDGIGLADIRKEGIAHAFAFRCTLDDTGDIDERYRRRQDALRAENLSQTAQAGIGKFHQSDIWLNSCEGV